MNALLLSLALACGPASSARAEPPPVPAPAPAARLSIAGTLEVPEHRLVRLTAAGAPDGAALIWDVSDEDAADVEELGDRLVFSAPPGSYRVKLRAIAGGAKPLVTTARVTVTVRAKAVPPTPGPQPGPAPTPPTPAPKPGTVKIKAVIVEETEDALLARSAWFDDAALAARWKAGGHPEPVLIDKNLKDPETRQTPARAKPYVDRAAGKALPQLYLVDAATGAILYEGPAYDSPADLVKTLDKLGG